MGQPTRRGPASCSAGRPSAHRNGRNIRFGPQRPASRPKRQPPHGATSPIREVIGSQRRHFPSGPPAPSPTRFNASLPHKLPCRAGPEKGPTPPVSTSRFGCRPQAENACRPRVVSAFLPRRQKQGPLRGGFHWGKPQTPAIMPWLTPGHPPRPPQPEKGRSTLIRCPSGRLIGGLSPSPKPPRQGI